ncbi:MAG: 4'-phosphopantetheinyl transferase superfamily protein [Deltaproteobacteria bacterium]|jgi:4'-phosphopantetheinyl transferase|nr:4'-phosphopantetheinyl transferase superfamily protein [Deltaproteobacteria bacterium]
MGGRSYFSKVDLASVGIIGHGVEIWLIELSAFDFDPKWLDHRLSPNERKRADKFLRPEDKRRFILSRAAVKEILVSYMTIARPLDEDFSYGPYGKPYWGDIVFSLAHCASMAILAVTNQVDCIGVDIELTTDHERDFAGIAKYFHPRERELLEILDGQELATAFYHMWVRKEAIMKATGQGLITGLDKVLVSEFSACHLGEIIDDHGLVSSRWWAPVLNVNDYLAAIALKVPLTLS